VAYHQHHHHRSCIVLHAPLLADSIIFSVMRGASSLATFTGFEGALEGGGAAESIDDIISKCGGWCFNIYSK
jgi:hypothetical protein